MIARPALLFLVTTVERYDDVRLPRDAHAAPLSGTSRRAVYSITAGLRSCIQSGTKLHAREVLVNGL